MENRSVPGRYEINLNGIWQIEPGERNLLPSNFTHSIEVPSVVDCSVPRYEWESFKYHWYKKEIFVPDGVHGKAAFLKLEQSMFGTAVWLNGNYVGESISCYTSQEYRVEKFFRYNSVNKLVVRVGDRSTLPAESAVGNDQERLSFIPGIWGDVKLYFVGKVRVKLVQTIPIISTAELKVNLWIENLSSYHQHITAHITVLEKNTGFASAQKSFDVNILPDETQLTEVHLLLKEMKLWSPESPALYRMVIILQSTNGEVCDRVQTFFGMREFQIIGSDFYLNNQKILLRGSNIAFHRFLSDPDRGRLPWQLDWVKSLLIDIPKAHNFNFFRAHLGHMYNRWYDIADEGGILIQDEWQFWRTSGSKKQIMMEFSQWLMDNWNHPSIVIWDPLNESTDELLQNEIIPEMKKLDPTRPWESFDFFEDHPYIYSLGPVLISRSFGYSRSLDQIKKSDYPSQVNEYLWWWLDKDYNPSELMRDIIPRWLGKDCTRDEIINHQSFLASELTELFRRLDVRCIQPFVYLSANQGPTSHWFEGEIEKLKPKPIMMALKNAFEPVGVSVELWDRHFYAGENRKISVHVFNDYNHGAQSKLEFGLKGTTGEWLLNQSIYMFLPGFSHVTEEFVLSFPEKPGDYYVYAAVHDLDTHQSMKSQKLASVYQVPRIDKVVSKIKVSLFNGSDEIGKYLNSIGFQTDIIDWKTLSSTDVLIVAGSVQVAVNYIQHYSEIKSWVLDGGAVLFIEPEKDIQEQMEFLLPDGTVVQIAPRMDRDRGGYDSYIIPDDLSHPIWSGIRKVDLRMFNGAYGGEIIPEVDLRINSDYNVLARSGIGLNRPVLLEKRIGKGSVVISSVEINGRLISTEESYTKLYARRPDPVAQLFLINLINYYGQKFNGLRSDKRVQ
ncbi:MAG: glycoside hydrolase family 2 protein [Candidatus Kryptoniota bacterium]